MSDDAGVLARRRMRAAMEAHDSQALTALMAPDVVLRSPIINTPFEGREAVSELYATIIERFTTYRYTHELEGDGVQMLLASGKLRGVDLTTVVALRVNADGLIEEFTIVIRPLAGVIAFLVELGPPIARRRGRWHALALRLISPPLPLIAKLVDLLAPRLIKLRG